MAYDLVRLDRNGVVLGTTTTVGAADDARNRLRPVGSAADVPHEVGPTPTRTVGGWVRLLPDGDGLVVTFLSHVDVPADNPLTLRIALGLAALNWQANAYAERWARVVEGPHAAQPTAWTYDEFRQREQAIRPFLARDESTGDVLVARAWNNRRCKANVTVFAEFTMADCMLGAVSPDREPVAAAGGHPLRGRGRADRHAHPRARRGRRRARRVRAGGARRQARHRRLRRAQDRRRHQAHLPRSRRLRRLRRPHRDLRRRRQADGPPRLQPGTRRRARRAPLAAGRHRRRRLVGLRPLAGRQQHLAWRRPVDGLAVARRHARRHPRRSR